ncbi:hypothetical protein BXZ70DRAFT_1005912 [Cristinia sonorae]|uniref:Uncharacterized protein n=1 Tax=Cristinia sonorae TaxID=1940300 RepID=A0A8K0XSC8_9AGAR|nr:hypothetical protein BXZ70DRAFT_1005912 [Cristinia sonorae]
MSRPSRLNNLLRIPISDLLHRGIVFSLVGVSIWGVVMIATVHRDKMRRGEEVRLAEQERQKLEQQAPPDLTEVRERELAEAAQNAIATGKFRS